MSRPELAGVMVSKRDSWPKLRLQVDYPGVNTVPEIGDVWAIELHDAGRLLQAYRAALGEIGGVRYFVAPEGYVWAVRPMRDLWYVSALPDRDSEDLLPQSAALSED